jgi:hypothetical protein
LRDGGGRREGTNIRIDAGPRREVGGNRIIVRDGVRRPATTRVIVRGRPGYVRPVVVRRGPAVCRVRVVRVRTAYGPRVRKVRVCRR